MPAHNNIFVENPVSESKHCFIFQLNLFDKLFVKKWKALEKMKEAKNCMAT